MDEYQARELDYGITMAVNTMVTAMGMKAENDQRKFEGKAMAYNQSDFDELIERNATHHNGVLGRWQGK